MQPPKVTPPGRVLALMSSEQVEAYKTPKRKDDPILVPSAEDMGSGASTGTIRPTTRARVEPAATQTPVEWKSVTRDAMRAYAKKHNIKAPGKDTKANLESALVRAKKTPQAVQNWAERHMPGTSKKK